MADPQGTHRWLIREAPTEGEIRQLHLRIRESKQALK
jgi:hypothetical protein